MIIDPTEVPFWIQNSKLFKLFIKSWKNNEKLNIDSYLIPNSPHIENLEDFMRILETCKYWELEYPREFFDYANTNRKTVSPILQKEDKECADELNRSVQFYHHIIEERDVIPYRNFISIKVDDITFIEIKFDTFDQSAFDQILSLLDIDNGELDLTTLFNQIFKSDILKIEKDNNEIKSFYVDEEHNAVVSITRFNYGRLKRILNDIKDKLINHPNIHQRNYKIVNSYKEYVAEIIKYISTI